MSVLPINSSVYNCEVQKEGDILTSRATLFKAMDRS
jgi:hypothetical protein